MLGRSYEKATRSKRLNNMARHRQGQELIKLKFICKDGSSFRPMTFEIEDVHAFPAEPEIVGLDFGRGVLWLKKETLEALRRGEY